MKSNINIMLLNFKRENARFEYAHEVLKNEDSYFMGQHIKRTRRISIICRNEPELENNLH